MNAMLLVEDTPHSDHSIPEEEFSHRGNVWELPHEKIPSKISWTPMFRIQLEKTIMQVRSLKVIILAKYYTFDTSLHIKLQRLML